MAVSIGEERELRRHWQRVRELMLQEADVAALSWRVGLAVLKDAKLDVTALAEPIARMMEEPSPGLLSNGKLNIVEKDEPPSNERSDSDSKEERRRQEELPHRVWDRFLAARSVVSIAVEPKSHRYLRCKNATNGLSGDRPDRPSLTFPPHPPC
jgi:hypothetical protein